MVKKKSSQVTRLFQIWIYFSAAASRTDSTTSATTDEENEKFDQNPSLQKNQENKLEQNLGAETNVEVIQKEILEAIDSFDMIYRRAKCNI